jgi:hypothetical protein
MIEFFTGLLIGLLIGGPVGILVIAMAISAAHRDRSSCDPVQHLDD